MAPAYYQAFPHVMCGRNMKLTNYEAAVHRQARLHKTVRIACAIMGVSKIQLSLLINHLHDQKGFLHVAWAAEPSERSRQAIQTAWGECGEPHEHVVHTVGEIAHEA